jgi:hypothetical protein
MPSSEPIVLRRPPNADEFMLGFAYDTNDFRNDKWILKGISQADRDKHCYMIGAHGSGKTKLMECFIRQDIDNKRGFGLIDPHGDLTEAVKDYLALEYPEGLDERVVYIDPTDERYCVAFNPLELMEKENIAGQADKLVYAFKKIWPDSWGARLDEILRNTLIALIESGQTLLEVHPMLTDPAVRRKFTQNIKNEACREFFGKFDDWSRWAKEEYPASTLNKVSSFLTDERIRRMFCASKSSFNLREIMDDGKILLVKLNKGQLGTNGLLIGALLLSSIQSAAMGRGDINEEDRKPWYLYIDEFQNFATESFTGIIDETRKYKLSLTLAHQNLGQVESQGLRRSLVNCGTQIYFRVSRPDAELLAKEAYAGVFTETPWEQLIQRLQSWPERFFTAKSKVSGGAVELMVPNVISAFEMSELPSREEFKVLVEKANIGKCYLRKREDIEKEYHERRGKLYEEEPESFGEKKK